MGAVAFQKGLGAIHSLSHPVGAVYGTHHGTTNAVVMPMVLDFNRPAIEDRITRAADYLGIAGGFDGFRARVMALRAELGIPATLSAMGVGRDRLEELTDMALSDPSCGGNPVPMTAQNTRALFELGDAAAHAVLTLSRSKSGLYPDGSRQAQQKVAAAALNFLDTLMIAGRYQVKPPFPFTPGAEVAGIVDAAGPGSRFAPGTPVCASIGTGALAFGLGLFVRYERTRRPPTLTAAPATPRSTPSSGVSPHSFTAWAVKYAAPPKKVAWPNERSPV